MKFKIVLIAYFAFLSIIMPVYKAYAESVEYSELVNKDVKYIIQDNNTFCIISLAYEGQASCLLISETGVTERTIKYNGIFNGANYLNNTVIISSTISSDYIETDTLVICAYDVDSRNDKRYIFDSDEYEDITMITADNKSNGYAVSTKSKAGDVDVFSYITNDFSKLYPNVGEIFSLYQEGNYIYFLGEQGLAIFDTDLHSFIKNVKCSVTDKIAYAGDEVLLTENGDIYLFDDNSLIKASNCNYNGGSAFYSDGNLFYFNKNSLYAYNVYSEREYLAYDSNGIILDFAVSDKKIGVLEEASTGKVTVNFMPFNTLNEQISDLANKDLNDSSCGYSLESEQNINDSSITDLSDMIFQSYTVDDVNKNICSFTGEISINNFKKLAVDGLKVNIYRADMAEKTSGKLATGMKVFFTTSDGKTDSYDAVIYGDVTGDGNINSNDLSAISGQILGKQKLDGVFYTAADIDNSGNISCADWLKFMQLYN